MARWPIRAAGAIYRTSDPTLAPVTQELERLSRASLTLLPEGENYGLGDLIRVTAAPGSGDLTLETLPLGQQGDLLLADAANKDAIWTSTLSGAYTVTGTLAFSGWADGSIGYTLSEILTELLVGAPGQVLGVSAGIPAWQTPSSYLAHALLSVTHTDTVAAPPVEGDLIFGNGFPAFWNRLPVGGPFAVPWVNPVGGGFGGPVPAWAANLEYEDLIRELRFTNGTGTIVGSDVSAGTLTLTGSTRCSTRTCTSGAPPSVRPAPP
jgi:hypothetical protein